jgi:hypothetical protein
MVHNLHYLYVTLHAALQHRSVAIIVSKQLLENGTVCPINLLNAGNVAHTAKDGSTAISHRCAKQEQKQQAHAIVKRKNIALPVHCERGNHCVASTSSPAGL